MTQISSSLLSNALSLDESDRSQLAEKLWDSLDSSDVGIEQMTEDEFETELLRRCEEAKRDPSVLIPWDVVRTMR